MEHAVYLLIDRLVGLLTRDISGDTAMKSKKLTLLAILTISSVLLCQNIPVFGQNVPALRLPTLLEVAKTGESNSLMVIGISLLAVAAIVTITIIVINLRKKKR